MPTPFHTSTTRPFSGQTACLFIHQKKNGERRRKRNLYLVTSRNHLNSYVKPQNRVDVNRRFAPSKMSREQAKESYPEWYQRVVVEKNKRQKKWDIKGKQGFALYNWWLNRAGEITGGHRYYYLMCLVIYACKCDVPKEKLKADMYEVFDKLKLIEHDNPLTEEDVESALEV